MGGVAEKMVIEAVDALSLRRYRACASGGGDRSQARCAAARDRGAGDADDRAPSADGDRLARDHRRHSGRGRSRAGRGSGQEHRQALAQDRHGRPGAPRDRRHQAHERLRDRTDEGRARRLCPARRRAGARCVGAGCRAGRAGGFGVPRSPDAYDGGSAQHHPLRPSSVLFEEHRADRRSRDEHRRDRGLSGDGFDAADRAAAWPAGADIEADPAGAIK